MTGLASRPRALLIMPSFFGYEKDISAEIDRHGYAVTFLDERPSNSAMARAVMRVKKNIIGAYVNSYYRIQLAELEGIEFAIVIVIKAEVVPRWFLESLRADNPMARFVFYTFDAIRNASECIALLHCFDQLFTFDRSDALAWPGFKYLPLFYVPEFTPPTHEHDDASLYSVSFVGTLHSERYKYVNLLMREDESAHAFLFMQARWYFAFEKYITRRHRDVPWSDVSFAPLRRREIAEVFQQSHAVLDVQRAGQSGLTMRTFEVLACGAILVTTNDAILDEPFFHPDHIVVISPNVDAADLDAVRELLGSLKRPGKAPDGLEAHSLCSWVNALLAGGVSLPENVAYGPGSLER